MLARKCEQLEIQRERIPIEQLIAAAISHVPELTDASMTINVADNVDLVGDAPRLTQCVTNFLSNAAKYGNGTIVVRVRQPGAETVIEVHDNGPGVPDIYQLVIWERFERGPQRQRAIPGAGIGLVVARGIARAHGGEAQYRTSELLGGACFSMSIPDADRRSKELVAALGRIHR